MEREVYMGYRTYVEGTQIFGSGERYKKWLEYIIGQGIEVDEDGSYDGYITDVQGAVEVIEEIILDMAKERLHMNYSNIFDFTDIFDEEVEFRNNNDYSNNFTRRIKHIMDNGYIFMSNKFLNACGDRVRQISDYRGKTERSIFYQLVNDNEKIHIKAE